MKNRLHSVLASRRCVPGLNCDTDVKDVRVRRGIGLGHGLPHGALKAKTLCNPVDVRTGNEKGSSAMIMLELGLATIKHADNDTSRPQLVTSRPQLVHLGFRVTHTYPKGPGTIIVGT